jgi:hypothetical protein
VLLELFRDTPLEHASNVRQPEIRHPFPLPSTPIHVNAKGDSPPFQSRIS